MLAVPDWDIEACEEAEAQAREVEEDDPDAAADMRAMAQAARRKLGIIGGAKAGRDPYDPMKLYARMAKYYGWSHESMEHMHFPTFFAYLREANEMIEEEKREYDRARRGHRANPGQIQGMFQEAEIYQGETIEI
ncbi:MAG: hypothetical protein PVSMB5_20010 [Ktedonobacteraceae bacterium]